MYQRNDTDQALGVYDTILSMDDTHCGARKRKIVIMLEKRQSVQAVKALKEYLDLFATDTEAWEQLLFLYREAKQDEHALFCCEELILLRPRNYTYLSLYADLYVDLGGYQNCVMARKYYLKALELCPLHKKCLHHVVTCQTKIDKKRFQSCMMLTRLILPKISFSSFKNVSKPSKTGFLKMVRESFPALLRKRELYDPGYSQL
jgi:tetratricopeptide (TPR) repeat protein